MQKIIRQSESVGSDTPEQISPPSTFFSLNTRGIKLTGLSDAGRGYHMHRPNPRLGHLLVTVGGGGRVWIDDQWEECGDGFAYVSPANVPSAFETQSNKRWQFAWVFFDASDESMRGLLTGSKSIITPAQGKPISTTIEGLYHEGIATAKMEFLEKWAELLKIYCNQILHPQSSYEIDPLARVWLEVDSRPSANWSISTLADLAGMSSEKLRKLCIDYHDRSPMHHVTYLRMRRAQSLLQSSSAKLAVIARMVGYRNVFAFSTAFRRMHRISPSEHREQSGSEQH